ncbi:MAG: FlgD immunoglobulin-like domain containing protein, partial [Candidatus Hydrogenedentota bacterium]
STTTVRVIVQDTSAPLTVVLDTPLKDLRAGGNELSIISTYGDSFTSVRYEFRSVNPPSGWMICTAAQGLSNPDTQSPFWGFFWDISGLVTGRQYDVRAVGTDIFGVTDPSPSFVRVTIDQVDSVIHEYREAATSNHIRRQLVSDDTTAQLMIADGTILTVPAGAISDTVWIRITEYDTAPSTVVMGTSFTTAGNGFFREFIREDGGRTFLTNVTITLPYSDTDFQNDRVGVTSFNEADLAIYHYDEYLKVWIKENSSVVDPVRNNVTATVNHFTIFAVLVGAPAAANISGVVVYPNPFVPYDNIDRNGKPYNAADPTSGIIFDSLPAQVSVEIFDAAGRLVATFSKASNDARYAWDARTDDGRELASGMYVAVIKSSTGERAIRKIMIVR